MSGLEELDDLMNQLSAAGRSTTASTPSASSRESSSNLDELDALMESLSADKAPSAPPPPPPRVEVAVKADVSYGEPVPKIQHEIRVTPAYTAPKPQVATTYTPPKPAPVSSAPKGKLEKDELNSLLSNLQSQMKNVDDGNVASKGICNYCKNPILGEVITAMGKVYHVDHFICKNCHAALGTRNFFEVEGQAQCETCYKSLSCPRCGHCDQPITDKCITALGRKWHPDHFVCHQCHSPFPSGQFFERDGKPFCERDFYGGFAPKCGACQQPITSDAVNALGQQWHPEHFNCTYCHKIFGSSPFYEHQGKPYCEAHYNQVAGSVCAGCSKAITGRAIQALNKKWHPEHFVCSFCNTPLPGTNHVENAGKAYCRGCHAKLFT